MVTDPDFAGKCHRLCMRHVARLHSFLRLGGWSDTAPQRPRRPSSDRDPRTTPSPSCGPWSCSRSTGGRVANSCRRFRSGITEHDVKKVEVGVSPRAVRSGTSSGVLARVSGAANRRTVAGRVSGRWRGCRRSAPRFRPNSSGCCNSSRGTADTVPPALAAQTGTGPAPVVPFMKRGESQRAAHGRGRRTARL